MNLFILKKIKRKLLKIYGKILYCFLKDRFIQHELATIQEKYVTNTHSLIVFLFPDEDYIGGGVLSVNSIFEETKSLRNIHNSEVITAKFPYAIKNPYFTSHSMFKNNINLIQFESAVKSFVSLSSLIMHIPECYVDEFVFNYKNKWSTKEKQWIKNIEKVHINILNQNILLMPSVQSIATLKEISSLVTQTTAHDKYGTFKTQMQFDVPLHHFSTCIDPANYTYKEYLGKSKIIMISPDHNEHKQSILKILRSSFPDFTLVTVKNMDYTDYKKLAAVCMFSITFGEGLDGYFLEPILSGGVSFAVYNEDFFSSDYQEIETVYKDYATMKHAICADIVRLCDKKTYSHCNLVSRIIIDGHYSQDVYKNNIKQFYLGNYSYLS